MDTRFERRKSLRINVTLIIRHPGSRYIKVHWGNVGFGGFAFQSNEGYRRGCKLEVGFQLPGTRIWIMTRGVILSVEEMGERLQVRGRFEHIDFEDERLFACFLMKQRGHDDARSRISSQYC